MHGEALHTTAVQQGGKPLRTLVALPEDDAEDLAALFDNLGVLAAKLVVHEDLSPRVMIRLDLEVRCFPGGCERALTLPASAQCRTVCSLRGFLPLMSRVRW